MSTKYINNTAKALNQIGYTNLAIEYPPENEIKDLQEDVRLQPSCTTAKKYNVTLNTLDKKRYECESLADEYCKKKLDETISRSNPNHISSRALKFFTQLDSLAKNYNFNNKNKIASIKKTLNNYALPQSSIFADNLYYKEHENRDKKYLSTLSDDISCLLRSFSMMQEIQNINSPIAIIGDDHRQHLEKALPQDAKYICSVNKGFDNVLQDFTQYIPTSDDPNNEKDNDCSQIMWLVTDMARTLNKGIEELKKELGVEKVLKKF